MLEELKKEANRTTTLNGASSLVSSGKFCLDLFAAAGAMRNISREEVLRRFYHAFYEDSLTAMKILFFARDIRGGLGERQVFRTIIKSLAKTEKDVVVKNLKNIPEYGRYDDWIPLLDTPCKRQVLALIKEQLEEDLKRCVSGNVSLLAKWLPSVNAANRETKRFGREVARGLSMTEKEYRKTLTKLRKRIAIIENHLREKDYSFDYEKQPSRALFKYRHAFEKNDGERYRVFLERARSGEARMNTGTLYPYDVIRPLFCFGWQRGESLSAADRMAVDTAWKALPDYTRGENAIAVVDGSGSMYGGGNPMPAEVALSLGIYFAERNTGAFKNHFITFSENPRLVEIKGRDIYEKVNYCTGFQECANTNIQGVFELILRTAVKNKLPREELPKTIYIISDMEFDRCAENADITNFEMMKMKFTAEGYILPKLVFWNVNVWNRQVPVKENESGTVLVSGCSPVIFEKVIGGETSPFQFMIDVIYAPRYDRILA